jgi:hypothetical protein
MAGIVQNSAERGTKPSARSSGALSPAARSAIRTDTVLLVCALFLQRFTLHLGGRSVSLSIAPAVVIFVYQFVSGRLLIQYERLWWFLLIALTATSSLLLNFDNSSLTSYSLFLVVYFMFTLCRPSSIDQYIRTLKGFQFLVLLLSCLAIAQFPAQLIVDPRKLIMFFGIFPDSLLPYQAGVNTLGVINAAGTLTKSNGIFLTEASTMSQIAALAILIEVIEFRRQCYLILLTIGFLLAYSGTGVSILLVGLPFVLMLNRKAQMSVLLVSIFAIGLLATGTIHLSAFTGRLGEFQNTNASGFIRFVSPWWMAGEYFNTASLSGLLFGNGLGGRGFVPRELYTASGDTWFDLVYEYGLLGAFIFTCFLGFCFRKSWCPVPVIVGIGYNYLFTGNTLLDPAWLIIIVVLCTLSVPESRSDHLNEHLRVPQRRSRRSRSGFDGEESGAVRGGTIFS